ncbi:adenylate kinase [Paenibacillus sp. VCA1]|uniref:AAA family ATPase n=1 Tax=Paenibacillus sp. VCA1 TaxID=3039148 RepID=UPI002871CD5B|nr:AAA family ATPase [Paenibacillus sp. VCA1]MDR9852919.1 adenylate kinase [Paenibacillus sp. VCA1]
MTQTHLPNIGLIGKLRAGKDEVARYLAEIYDYTRFAFGDALKDDFHRRYPEIPREPKPRAGYKFHGQFMREHLYEDIWIRRCLAEVKRQYYGSLDFRAVITDVRQLNEAQALKSAGYTLVRVTAPDTVRIDRAIKSGDKFDYGDLMHGTETALDGFPADFTVDNGGTLDRLYAQIDEIMAYLSGDWPE